MIFYKRFKKYFEKHTDYCGLTHLLLGIGIGTLITYPVAGVHPVRFGLTFIALGIAGHVWAATQKP